MKHRLAPLSLALALFVGFTAGCASEPENGSRGLPETSPEAPAEQPAEQPSDGSEADSAGAGPGIDLPALIERADERGSGGELRVLDAMNPPLRIEREAVRNRHDPAQTDTIRTLVYEGLRIEVYVVTASNREMIRQVEVTGGDYRTAEGVTVGSTRGRVRQALGEPDRTEEGVLVYDVYESENDPTPTQLSIRFDGERVAAMTWDFYVD